MTDELVTLRDELAAFLKKLGLDVEFAERGLVYATRRTALAQERTKFRVVETLPPSVPKTTVHILPDSAPRPRGIDNAFRLGDFLDRTVQADVLCSKILSDPQVARDLTHFVPQQLDVDGEPQSADAPNYVSSWLAEVPSGLLVVLAPAGYGKTVLTRVIAHRLATAHLRGNDDSPFPFLIPFGDFRRVASFESMIIEALQRSGVIDYTPAAFAHLVQSRRCALLLDGFDELLEERPEEARKNLRELIETLSGAGRVMVTARSTFFRTSTDVADFLEHGVPVEDVTIVDLRPFDSLRREMLVQKLAPDQRTINYINQILEVEGVTEAMGSPLLLRETIEALADAEVRKKLTAKTKRSDLFTVLEASVYERERQRHGHRFPDLVQARFIERAAEEMLRANTRGFDSDSIHVLALEAASDFGFEAPDSDYAQLADHHFLTVDYASADVRFNHQVFREYFQAKALRRAAGDTGVAWVRSVLQERPLPEEVARFLSEAEDAESQFADLCSAAGTVRARGHLASNLSLLSAAVGTRRALTTLLATVSPDVALELRLSNMLLSDFDFGVRMFERLEFTDCELSGADLGETLVRELSLSNTSIEGARFAAGSPDVLQINYEQREFEPTRIAAELTRLGAIGLHEAEVTADVEGGWRDRTRTLVASRLRRFQSGQVAGVSLWDVTISEKNLLGGLNQVDRLTVSQMILPALIKNGVITRHREHNIVVYRLTDAGKDDGNALLMHGRCEGTLEAALNAVDEGAVPAPTTSLIREDE